MSNWKIEEKVIETDDSEIQCGIFQGDTLSPLLFCICLIPLTEKLNKLNTGYEEHTTRTKVSHWLYMENLKLVGKTQEGLQKQMQTIGILCNDIHMVF
jgi:hypothetical protein